jgi:NADPH:quinone reductase-like Zn-dependent oxidoreductase
MKAALVVKAGEPPVYGEFRDPLSAAGKSVIRVHASAISQLAKLRASGQHYSSEGALPFIPGVDGCGIDETGQRVYFMLPEKPFGAMAELCIVDQSSKIPLPDDLDDDTAAAMAIPGMSSWAALSERAHLVAGETVLINGATGTSGRLAIQIARHLGAKRIIVTGRQTKTFDELKALGADVTIQLVADSAALGQVFDAEFKRGIDIVLDYLWGNSAETLLASAARSGAEGAPIRFVQIGSISGGTISLPGPVLRSSSLQLMGSGLGSVPMPRLIKAIGGVLGAAMGSGFKITTEAIPLAEVARAWAAGGSDSRIVLHP